MGTGELNSYISLEERADFIDSILDTARYNGKIFGLPWMMTGYTMLLNTDKFNERNVSLPEKEWTRQFVKVLKQLLTMEYTVLTPLLSRVLTIPGIIMRRSTDNR